MGVPADPRRFARDWTAAWNRRDLDFVLALFSDSMRFLSPLIPLYAGEPSGCLRGKSAVRAYWDAALARLPDLHFELVDVLTGVDCVVILSRGHKGLTAEYLHFGPDGKADEGRGLYAV